MDWPALLACLAVGIAIVAQSGLNRDLALSQGLAAALFYNCCLTCLLSGALWVLVLWFPQNFPALIRSSRQWFPLKSAHLGAALGGCCIILGMPIAISRLGAVRALSLVITVQLSCGLIWDAHSGVSYLSAGKILGVGVMLLGAWLSLAL